jgi:hypothetical protein
MTMQEPAVMEPVAQPLRRHRPVITGLCGDCVKAETCTFQRDPAHPVRSCEEFEGAGLSTGARRPFVVAAPIFPAEPDPLLAAPGELKGLCRQCARRQTCSYPKPPEGVWQCDELA